MLVSLYSWLDTYKGAVLLAVKGASPVFQHLLTCLKKPSF